MSRYFAACLGIIVLLMASAGTARGEGSRRVVSLNGVWQIAEGKLDAVPGGFDRTVPVPGLASLAAPPFADPPGPEVANRRQRRQKDPHRDAFWYRRTFRFGDPVPDVVRLKVHKAMFGSQVILNGRVLGVHEPSFTPGWFDAKAALKTGENELLIRVGADRDAISPGGSCGFDFEKRRYIPGIFDSVELILSGTPHFTQVQTASDVAAKQVRVQAVLRNDGSARTVQASFTVREAKSGRVAGRVAVSAGRLAARAETTLDVRIPIADCRPWSPEDPFLYVLEADSGADACQTRFGMREFRFDPAAGRAMLNGKPYFMRGSNVTLYRFFEDSECQALPWNEQWVRTLHRRVKDMHWNCLRYCIGLPPESWYDVADEEGILIQDEYPLWDGGANYPKELKRDQLAVEYAEWMRERWNHPCLVIWDASNETTSSETGPAIQKVRGLDLSNRPWNNSDMPPLAPGDVFESHPYHFKDANFKLRDLASASLIPEGDESPIDGRHAVIINEYGWLWLNRDGTPTTLTQELYSKLLGPKSTTSERRRLYARYLAAETEFWRCHRKVAGVMHFTALAYARPDGQTSDHWIDVENLRWEPEFYRYVRDAFAPAGLMIDAWADEYPAGRKREFPVLMINDVDDSWTGTVRFRLLRDGKPLVEETQRAEIPAFGSQRQVFALKIPDQSGSYQVEASLVQPDREPVCSLRDFSVRDTH